MKKHFASPVVGYALLTSAVLFPALAQAATCTVGGGVSVIGNELFATHDYGNGYYNFNITMLMCSGGRLPISTELICRM